MKLEAEMTLSHLSLRREIEGEGDGPVAADIKLTANMAPGKVSGLFASKTSFEQLLKSLYRDDGELVTSDLDSMVLAREYTGVEVNLDTLHGKKPVEFADAKLNKITLEPKAGRVVGVTLRLQVHPTGEQVARLSDMQKMTVNAICKGGELVKAEEKQTKMDLATGPEASAAEDESAARAH